MFKYNDYVLAESLEQAYELNQSKMNIILGGTGWLKMQDRQVGKAIDLSKLSLDKITEDAEQFKIGCMVTLRDLEKHQGLNDYTYGAICESVKHIVGVQFRNCATVGGSIYGRFGFSDVLTMFLALDTYVELYKGGIIPLADFAKMDYDNDILVNIIVKKLPINVVYSSFRNQSTDFPVLSVATSLIFGEYRTVIGARPNKAFAVSKDVSEVAHSKAADITKDKSLAGGMNIEEYAEWVSEQYNYGDNMRASGAYRKMLAKTLTKRNMKEIMDRFEEAE